ncbi:MAG: methyltransferase [Alphaproteobacteria bacterium]|nr:methyltransferase [Alphaproteobacteria bacterium]
MSDLTCDAFLGGKLRILQPKRGFRAGLDAVLLAAAVPARSGDEIAELGAGCGTASLCLASRVAGCAVTGVEIDRSILSLAVANAEANGLSERVSFIEADALDQGWRARFDHVFANPPFHLKSERSSPVAGRAKAKQDLSGLGAWIHAGLQRAVHGGTLTVIVRADRLAPILDAASGHSVTIFPLWPHENEPAKRVIVRFRKHSKTGLKLLAGLVLHRPSGDYTASADSVLRGNASINL